MNPQKLVLVIGLIAFGLCVLYPPWVYTVHAPGYRIQKDAGYSFVAIPPRPLHPEESVRLDAVRLLVQIAGITAGTAILWAIARK